MPFAGPERALAATISSRDEEKFIGPEIMRPAGSAGPPTTFQSLTPRLNDLRENARAFGKFSA